MAYPVATPWPFRPNWSSSFTETVEFKTDIITSTAGNEQRRALRARPRLRFEFQAMPVAEELVAFNRLMAKDRAGAVLMPYFGGALYTVTPFLTGDNSVEVEAEDRFFVGTKLFVCSAEDFQVFTVDTVTGLPGNATLLTFEEESTSDWPVGSLVLTALPGWLDDDLTAPRRTSKVAEAAIAFTANPEFVPPYADGTPDTVFDGREVFPFAPNWSENLDVTHSWPTLRSDFERGAIRVFRPVQFPSELREAAFLAIGEPEAFAMKQFFVRMRGQRGEFYMPTGENDLPPVAQLVAGQSTLFVAGVETEAAYDGSTVFRAIRVLLTDGTELYRKVNSIFVTGGNSQLNLSAAWASTIPLSAIESVSWMPVCRLASDILTLEWVTDAVATTRLAIRTLENLPAESL